jgi:hypothetical protein
MKSKQNPSFEFDPEEKQLLHDFETNALRSIATRELLDDLKKSAHATGHKDQRINILKRAAQLCERHASGC